MTPVSLLFSMIWQFYLLFIWLFCSTICKPKVSDRTSSSTYRTSSCSEMPGSHSQSGTMQNKPKESWEIEKGEFLI